MSFSESVKKVGTIQPTDCSCLPEIFIHACQFAIEEKVFNLQEKVQSIEKYIGLYPASVSRQEKLLSEDPQYQRGLVTPGDIGFVNTRDNVSHLKDVIAGHEYILKQLNGMPRCRG